MTGRELIIYILQYSLEDVEMFGENGVFVGFMSAREAAEKFGVGEATVRTWYFLGKIDGLMINNELYFLKSLKDPRS